MDVSDLGTGEPAEEEGVSGQARGAVPAGGGGEGAVEEEVRGAGGHQPAPPAPPRHPPGDTRSRRQGEHRGHRGRLKYPISTCVHIE